MSKEDLKNEEREEETLSEETKDEEVTSEDVDTDDEAQDEANESSKKDEDEVSEENKEDDESDEKEDDDSEDDEESADDKDSDDDDDEDVDEDETEEKKSNPILLIIFLLLVLTIVFLLWQKNDDKKVNSDQAAAVIGNLVTFNNDVHGFEMQYPESFQLIANGSIPQELVEQGIESIEMMGLSNGDALLVEEESANMDNIIYTILALSNQPAFTTTADYVEELRVNLNLNGEEAGFEFSEGEVVIGKQEIDAAEFSFEMEVPDADGVTMRPGAFYDTIFEHEGTTFSVSFGYPKDVENADQYLEAYEAILASIDFSAEGSGTVTE